MRAKWLLCLAMVMAAAPLEATRAASPPAPRAAPVGDPDPEDRKALVAVCGACHPVNMVDDNPRSMPEWLETMQTMVDRGAKGTDEQYDRIVNYLRLALATINVNTAPAEELAPTLGISPAAADAIVARRAKAKLTSLADLTAVSGVDRAAITARAKRIGF